MLPRRSQRPREAGALLLAGSLHVAALIGLGGWGIHHARQQPRMLSQPSPQLAPVVASEVELQLDAPGPNRMDEGVADFPYSLAARRGEDVQRSAPQRPPVARVLPRSANDVEPVEPVASAESSPSAPKPDSMTPSRAIDLGLGSDDWRRWLSETKAVARAEDRPPRPRRALFRAPPVSTSGGLQEGLEAHDRAIGLRTSGPVVSALYHAAHGDLAPSEGVARFLVTVLDTGAVEVALSDASGDLPGWRAVATHAADALRRTPPAIPKPRQAARIVVEVSAKQIFPNGLETKQLHALRSEVEPPRLRSVQSAQRELTDRNPVSAQPAAPGASAAGSAANVNRPGLYVAARGKVCGARLGLTLLGLLAFDGGCDLSNLGAKPQRLVSTIVREETLY